MVIIEADTVPLKNMKFVFFFLLNAVISSIYLVPYLNSLQLTKIAWHALITFMLPPSSCGPKKLFSSPQLKVLTTKIVYDIKICSSNAESGILCVRSNKAKILIIN